MTEEQKVQSPKISKARKFTCSYLDIESGEWVQFKSFFLKTPNEEIFHITNTSPTSTEVLERQINYNFHASFSRVLHSDMLGASQREQVISSSKKFYIRLSGDSMRFKPQNSCYVIFKNLEKKTEGLSKVELYHIFSFSFNPDNLEVLDTIKRKISRANFLLRYYDHGLKFQIKQRIHYLTYKSMKQVLRLLAHLLGVPMDGRSHNTLQELFDLYDEDESRKKFMSIVNQPAFLAEIKSLVYKVIASLGLFPSYVEINTMAEDSLVLWAKKIFSTAVSAPWGSSHHASFSVGNHRYSFINLPEDPSMQNKVNVSLDIHREFRSSQSAYKYFRFQFFDFFPMNNWIDEISNFIHRTLQYVKILEFDDGNTFPNLMKTVQYKLSQLMEGETFPTKIAQEFNERYSDLLWKPSDTASVAPHRRINPMSYTYTRLKTLSSFGSNLSKQKADWIFMQFTELIAKAEIRGYSQFSNNCQTIVSEVMNLFCSNFHLLLEPLCIHTLFLTGNPSIRDTIKKNFQIFESSFNKNLLVKVQPFSLIHQVPYFGTYGDIDTCNLLDRNKFGKLQRYCEKYMKKPEVFDFLRAIKDSYKSGIEPLRETLLKQSVENSKIMLSVSLGEDCKSSLCIEGNPYDAPIKSTIMVDLYTKPENPEKLELPSTRNASKQGGSVSKLDFKSTEQFSFISHLLYILYNELFMLRMKIKINKRLIEEIDAFLEKGIGLESKKSSKTKKIEERQKAVKENEALHQKKYGLINCYREVCYYYYNSVRVGFLEKYNDNASCLGFLLIKNPEYRSDFIDSPEQRKLSQSFETIVENDPDKRAGNPIRLS